MNIKDIQKLSTLSRIDINKNEQVELLEDMEAIIGYVDDIQKAVTNDNISKVGKHRNIMREDIKSHDIGEYTKEILDEVPYTQDGYIKVKKIL